MAEQHGVMKDAIILVVSEQPDICQVGPKKIPTPFEILTDFAMSKMTTPKVQFQDQEAFVVNSLIPLVRGNEASAPWGGIKTGRLAGGGACYVVDGSHTQVVKAQKQLVVRNLDRMWMNGVAPPAPGNTTGVVIFVVVPPANSVDENGKPKGPTKPGAQAETGPEAKYSGRSATEQTRPGNLERASGPQLRRETETMNESVFRTGTKETGQFDLGNFTRTSYQTASESSGGGLNAGFGGTAGFATLRAQQTFGGAGQWTQGSVNAEFLSAGASGGGKVTLESSAVGAEGSLGAEVNLAKAAGSWGIRLTLKKLYDATIGEYAKAAARAGDWRAARLASYSPPDTGLVIELKGSVGVGAAAEVQAKAKYDAHAEKKLQVGAGIKAGAGPSGSLRVDVSFVSPPKTP